MVHKSTDGHSVPILLIIFYHMQRNMFTAIFIFCNFFWILTGGQTAISHVPRAPQPEGCVFAAPKPAYGQPVTRFCQHVGALPRCIADLMKRRARLQTAWERCVERTRPRIPCHARPQIRGNDASRFLRQGRRADRASAAAENPLCRWRGRFTETASPPRLAVSCSA